MKVILTEKVSSLGNVGDIVRVSAGHARNYLLPNNLAVFADESNQKSLDDQQKRLSKKITEQESIALKLKEQLEGVELQMYKRVGTSGKIFGTVTNADLSKQLSDKGLDIEKRLIVIEKPIRGLGKFDIKAKLFSGVDATFKIQVLMDPKQVEEEKKRAKEKKKTKKVEKQVEVEIDQNQESAE